MEIGDAAKLNGQMGFANKVAANLVSANESTWMRMGNLAESMHDPEKAIFSYENVLRHNPYNVKALTQIASICRLREQYPKAVEYFQRILNYENTNGEIWGALGHCYLMMDDLQKAYTAYQQALYHLPNPKDPNLWYGIGILYDRYGSFEHAEEAFTAVLKMDPKFEKSSEIHFRLGIIYKQQVKYEEALNRFRFILAKPPRPLTQADIYFQIGHVHELQKDFGNAKEAYERVLKETPNHAKSLQQLGWLYHSNPTMGNQDVAINYLLRSLDAEPSDGQTWYLLGRCYMAQQQYRKAYDAYQQAVYRDGRNPTFWCSIGVLYYQINQYRDALDAYSRAIRLNPYLSEVWYDLGTLYESCNQISDSLDAYERAAKLDPGNKHIQQRLSALRDGEANKEGEKKSSDGKTPMTMEPRAAHHHVGNEANMNRMDNSQAAQMVVADLVDLSEDKLGNRNLPHLPKVRENKDQPVPLSPSASRMSRDDRRDVQPLQMRPFNDSSQDNEIDKDGKRFSHENTIPPLREDSFPKEQRNEDQSSRDNSSNLKSIMNSNENSPVQSTIAAEKPTEASTEESKEEKRESEPMEVETSESSKPEKEDQKVQDEVSNSSEGVEEKKELNSNESTSNPPKRGEEEMKEGTQEEEEEEVARKKQKVEENEEKEEKEEKIEDKVEEKAEEKTEEKEEKVEEKKEEKTEEKEEEKEEKEEEKEEKEETKVAPSSTSVEEQPKVAEENEGEKKAVEESEQKE